MQMQAYLSDAAPKHHLVLLGFAVAPCLPPADGYNMSNIFSAQRCEKPLTGVDVLMLGMSAVAGVRCTEQQHLYQLQQSVEAMRGDRACF